MPMIDQGDEGKAPKPEEAKEGGASLSLASLTQDKQKCTEDTTVKQLAKVGPYEQNRIDKQNYCEGAMHGGSEHSFSTIDARSHEPLKLTDIFKREDIYNALMKEPLVTETLKNGGDDVLFKNPKDFDELETDLYGKDGLGIPVYSDKKDSQGNEVTFTLGPKILTDFAFHDVKDGMVGTRLLPDYSSEATRNAMYQLGVYLPIPAGLEGEFKAAAARKNGEFLMKDSEKYGKVSTRHKEWERSAD